MSGSAQACDAFDDAEGKIYARSGEVAVRAIASIDPRAARGADVHVLVCLSLTSLDKARRRGGASTAH